jgi:ankyrin repeat protein
MFPHPHDALPLPPRPSLEQYKKRAKDLLKASQSSDPAAIRAWAARWIDSLLRLSGLTLTPQLPVRVEHWTDELETFARNELPQTTSGLTHSSVPPSAARPSQPATLTAAQFVIARAHGFESWPKLAKHLESVAHTNSPLNHFEQAVDAIVTGNLNALENLLREHPDLARARSSRRHEATLLHYVSANGIEGYRQKTPANIVPIAELLLNSGADVNAIADLYGGSTTLALVATSLHPERAGVQSALLQVLLDHGATIDAPNSRATLVTACLANGRLQAAEFLARQGAKLDLEAATGLGRLEKVKTLFAESATNALLANERKERALLWACEYGRNSVVEFLLDRGVNIESQANTGQPPLHWAVIGAHADTITLLLNRGANLEAKNMYGGTALDQALWSARNGDPAIDYAPIITLLKHGAKPQVKREAEKS